MNEEKKGVFCGNISLVMPDDTSGPAVAYGTKVFQDGVEIKNVRRIVITLEPDGLVMVNLDIIPHF